VKGDDTASIGILNFEVFVNGTGYSAEFAVCPGDKPEIKTVTLLYGGISKGWILFEVPQGGEISISFSYLFSDPNHGVYSKTTISLERLPYVILPLQGPKYSRIYSKGFSKNMHQSYLHFWLC